MFRECVRFSRKWLAGARTQQAESHRERIPSVKENGSPTITATEELSIEAMCF